MPTLPATIMIIDDDRAVAQFAQTVLEHHGYRVLVSTSRGGPAELDAAASPGIDLVLLDYVIPFANGVEILRRLRARTRYLPVVVSSGSLDTEGLDAMRALGFSALLPKPYTCAHLRSCIDGVLRSHATAADALEPTANYFRPSAQDVLSA